MHKEYTLTVDKHGRMVLPKDLRKELDLHKSTKVVASSYNGEIHLKPMNVVIDEARALIAKHCTDLDLQGELKKMRNEEYHKESEEVRKFDNKK